MSDPRDIEDALRASLAEHARYAPTGAGLADEIVSAAARPTPTDIRRARRWGTWTLPLIAAGSVAAVAIALVSVNQPHHSAEKHAPAVSNSVQPPSPTVSTPAPSPVTTDAVPHSSGGLKNFVVSDMTFVSADEGLALGTANCLHGAGTCTAMMHTTDGATWHMLTNPPVNVSQVNGCTSKCASGIRFANSQIGYAFGQDVFFMTTDGGTSWHQQPGGADALETLDGNVIRLVSDHSGCPGPCNLRVELAPIGTAKWTTVKLPGGVIDAGGAQLVRTGHVALIETISGHAGSLLGVALYASTDDGQHWAKESDPCASVGASEVGVPVASQGMSPAADGSVSILCGGGGVNGADQVVITSNDGGGQWLAEPKLTVPTGGGVACCLTAVSITTMLVQGGDGWIYRTTDSGAFWGRAFQDSSNGGALNGGFETPTTGRYLSADGRTIWTTRNGGQSWSRHTFA